MSLPLQTASVTFHHLVANSVALCRLPSSIHARRRSSPHLVVAVPSAAGSNPSSGPLFVLVLERYRRRKLAGAIRAVSTGVESAKDSTISFEGFTISSRSSNDGEIKIRLNVSGAKTQDIFDGVFSKLVAAAQPIPGFRRVKGGKTPDIPKDVLLHILGPSKVHKQAIKKIINTTVAEYVAKEGLKVTKDLRVEQSFEELEVCFEPGKDFGFDAILKSQEAN